MTEYVEDSLRYMMCKLDFDMHYGSTLNLEADATMNLLILLSKLNIKSATQMQLVESGTGPFRVRGPTELSREELAIEY